MRTRQTGRWLQQPENYRAFVPHSLPPDPPVQLAEADQKLLSEAALSLGRLDSVSDLVPDPDRFVMMYCRQEAVLSSQIEGTQASLADLLDFEAEQGTATKTVDVAEVLNYLKALSKGLELLDELPVCNRLLCRVHDVLMAEVRGGESGKTPGVFRTSQNWIGGSRPGNAMFVPPPPWEVPKAMGDLEKFLNTDKPMPLLVEVAIAHAQFETIHPFLDGNGRVGRLLIMLLLASRGALKSPLLYLSHYLKRHRDEYYARLQAIRIEGDWEGWLTFFLTGVQTVAQEAAQRARFIIELVRLDKEMITLTLGRRAANALRLHDHLIKQPIVTGRLLREHLGLSDPTINSLLNALIEIRILRQRGGEKWRRKYAYHRYLELFTS